MIRFRITYVDSDLPIEGDAIYWPNARSDGVYEVVVTNSQGSVTFKGKSVYWCYPEGDAFVFGAGSFYRDLQPPEVVFTERTQTARPLAAARGIPDLLHDQLKLGWWRGSEMEL